MAPTTDAENGLKGEKAAELNEAVQKAKKGYAAAVANTAKATEETKTTLEDLESEAYERYMAAASLKRRFLQEVIDRLNTSLEGLDAQASKETAKIKTEINLTTAALNDITIQIQDLETKKQERENKRRNPAPQRKSKATIVTDALAEEIAAVLKEAEKVKVNEEVKKAAAKTAPKKAESAKPAAAKSASGRYRLKSYYAETVAPALVKHFNYANVNQAPRLDKIIINMGLGDVKDDGKKFNLAVEELKIITGQKPLVTKARKSIANFKLREGQNIGAKVTIRGMRMYEFYDKLVSIALPRVRDFKGVPNNSFDGRGNYAMGVKEQLIFPEIRYDQVDKVRGFDVCIVTTAKTDIEAKKLLELMGMPFKA